MAATALFGPLALAAEVTKSVESKEGETIIADWLFVQNSRSITYTNGNSPSRVLALLRLCLLIVLYVLLNI